MASRSNGRIPPTQDRQAFFAHNPLQDPFADQPLVPLNRQEHHADAVFARKRQGKTEPGALAFEKSVRDLYQNSRAVSGDRIAAAGSPVLQIHEYLNAFEDDIVRPFSLDVCDETDAAGIPLKTRVVQTLAGRVPTPIAPLFHQSHTFPRRGTFHVALLAPE